MSASRNVRQVVFAKLLDKTTENVAVSLIGSLLTVKNFSKRRYNDFVGFYVQLTKVQLIFSRSEELRQLVPVLEVNKE